MAVGVDELLSLMSAETPACRGGEVCRGGLGYAAWRGYAIITFASMRASLLLMYGPGIERGWVWVAASGVVARDVKGLLMPGRLVEEPVCTPLLIVVLLSLRLMAEPKDAWEESA